MTLVQRAASNLRCLQKVPLRFQSTAQVLTGQDSAVKDVTESVEWSNAKPYEEIPGPKPLPIIGNTWRFLPAIGEFYNKSFVSIVDSFPSKYGTVSKLAGMPGKPDMVFLFDADDIQKVLRTEGTWPIRVGADSLEYYFVHVRKNFLVSLTVLQGKEWQEFRTAINQVMMQPRNTKQYIEPIDRVTQEFIDRMRSIRDSNNQMPADFVDEVAKWSLESITYVALDKRLGILRKLDPNSEASQMIDAVRVVFRRMYELDFLPSPWKYISTPAYRDLVKSLQFFTGIASKYVNEAMERLKKISPTDAQDRNFSVLENLLLQSNDPNKAVSMALDMLLAGVDTTSMVVMTAFYQLANNPEKQRLLQEELDRVIPDPSKPLTKEQLEELKYLRACIKESMRGMPILIGNVRNTGRDLVLGGYRLPKGTMTTMSNPYMFSNEKYFPRAKEFLPERWLPNPGDDLKAKHPFAFLPFGFGPRMCVGKRFAELEIETILAKTFRNFQLEWNHPPAETVFRLILTFTSPMKFTVKDRV